MNERIRKIRKKLGLTMEKFGERIGVAKSTISNIENGNCGPSNQIIKSICREFNVDPYWLETGDGDKMFIELSDDDELISLVQDVLIDKDNPFFHVILATIKSYRQLTPENKAILHTYLKTLLENLQTDQGIEKDDK